VRVFSVSESAESVISRLVKILVLRAQCVGTDAEIVRSANFGRADAESLTLL